MGRQQNKGICESHGPTPIGMHVHRVLCNARAEARARPWGWPGSVLPAGHPQNPQVALPAVRATPAWSRTDRARRTDFRRKCDLGLAHGRMPDLAYLCGILLTLGAL